MTPRWVVYDEPAGGGGGGPWDPSQLSTLAAWYDADAITGLSSGQTLSTWADSAGSNDVSGSGTYNTPVLNGKAAISFDGNTDDFSVTNSDVLNAAPDAWMYAVWKGDASNNAFLGYVSDAAAANSLFAIQPRFNGIYWFRTQNAALVAASGGSINNGTWSIVGMRTDGATQFAYEDGAALSLGNPTVPSGFPSQTAALLAIGNDNFGNHLDGSIAELLIGNGALTNTEREQLDGYLAHKWGLAGNLPVSHPYKNAAP